MYFHRIYPQPNWRTNRGCVDKTADFGFYDCDIWCPIPQVD